MKIKSNVAYFASLAIAAIALTGPAQANAFSYGDFFLNPSVSVGYNSQQGTVMRFGVDAGMHLGNYLHAGVGGFYGAGNHPEHDREIGGGPFVGLAYPVFDFLTLQLREDVDYVDVRLPITTGNPPEVTAHETRYGVESATSAGAHFSFGQSFGISGGYRMVVGLNRSDIAKGRSGPYAGVSIGF